MGQIGGIAVDPRDRVWVESRRNLTKDEMSDSPWRSCGMCGARRSSSPARGTVLGRKRFFRKGALVQPPLVVSMSEAQS